MTRPKVAVIIPALNEAENLRELLPTLVNLRAASGGTADPGALAFDLAQVIVADNGSTDATRAVTLAMKATHVFEPRRGYGAACHAGMRQLAADIDIVVFLDADLSDDPTLLPELIEPIIKDNADLVIGARVRRLRTPGAMTFPQIFGNGLATTIIRCGWGQRYTDLGPFRAIRRSALERIDVQDRAFGWTVEMQIRAVEEGLRIREVAVPYRRRKGKSKISGTLRGVVLAGYWILGTCAKLWWRRP